MSAYQSYLRSFHVISSYRIHACYQQNLTCKCPLTSVVSSHTIIKSKSSPKSNVCKSQVESSFSSDGPSRVQVRVTPKSSRVESSQSRIVHRPMGYTIGLCSFYYIEQTSVGLRYRYRMNR